jgi:hypothetical protein
MAAVLAGTSWEGVFSAAHRDGRTVPIRVLDIPLNDPVGGLAGVAGFSVPVDDSATDLRAAAVRTRMLDALASTLA